MLGLCSKSRSSGEARRGGKTEGERKKSGEQREGERGGGLASPSASSLPNHTDLVRGVGGREEEERWGEDVVPSPAGLFLCLYVVSLHPVLVALVSLDCCSQKDC